MRTQYAVLFLSVLISSCGSAGPEPKKEPPTELTPCPECGGAVRTPALAQGVVAGLTISEIAFFQALKVPVMKDGQKADRGSMPLVGKRDAFVRVYVTADPGFQQKAVTPRAKLITRTPTGFIAQVFSGDLTVVKGSSTEEVLESTINFTLPGELLKPDTSFSLTLTTEGGAPPKAGEPARWPQDGSVSGLDVGKGGGALMRVMLVPVQYNADGSGRLPDTSDEQLAVYRDIFYRLYPAGAVEVTVRDPFPWSQTIQGNGAGYNQLLMAMSTLRGQDNADPDLYYYGIFMAQDSFGQFCGGGCITGLSPVGAPYSVGIGFPGPGSAWTAAHEVGHAHGLQHAPCGGAGGPDPNFPYKDGGIGVWGFDPIDKQLKDPTGMTNGGKPKDVMGYCQPSWISDYHYEHLADRLFSDNGLAKDYHPGPNEPLRPHAAMVRAVVASDGAVSMPDGPAEVGWPERGEPRAVIVGDEQATGYWFPYDHLPGGVLMVPEAVRQASHFAPVRVKL